MPIKNRNEAQAQSDIPDYAKNHSNYQILLKKDSGIGIFYELFRLALPIFFFLLLSVGLTSFISIFKQISSFSIVDHTFRSDPLFFLIVSVIIFLILFSSWRLTAKAENRIFHEKYTVSLQKTIIPYLPFTFSLLSLLLLRHYISSSDLRYRLLFLAVFMALTFVLLKLLQRNYVNQIKRLSERVVLLFERLPRKKQLLILFLIAFALYNLYTGFLVSRGGAFSGDEPYYLLTTHSLYQDQDINLANNYVNRDYFHFFPRELYPNLRLRAYARFGKKGTEYVYPINQPGISFLMLPFYGMSQLFSGRELIFILKGSLSVWAALLGLQLYLFAGERWKKEKISLQLWFLYSFTAPVLFYAFHLYPEIPIAFFSLLVYRKARSQTAPSLRQYFLLGFILSLFFWFGLKYNMIFWPLLLVSTYFLIKEHKAGWRILCFLSLPLLSLGLNYYYIYVLYGTFNPIAIYEGVVTANTIQNYKEIMLKTPLMLRIDSLLDYFFDQRDGLLLYSPIYFFSFVGLITIFRKSRREAIVLLLITFPFILNYAFFAHRQGGSPQGRVLTPISWIAFVLIAYFLVYNRKKLYALLFRILVFASLAIPPLLILNPSALYQPTTHGQTFRGGEFFVSLSNLYFYFPGFLPSFLKENNLFYVPNYIWLGLVLIFFFGYLAKKEFNFFSRYSTQAFGAMALLTGLFFWFSFFPRTVLFLPTKVSYSPGKSLGFYSLDRYLRKGNPGEFHLSKNRHDYQFNFTSWKPIDELKLGFGSLEGRYKVEIKLFDLVIFQGETFHEIKSLSYPSPPRYMFKKTHLYQLNIRFSHISGKPVTEELFFLSVYPSIKR